MVKRFIGATGIVFLFLVSCHTQRDREILKKEIAEAEHAFAASAASDGIAEAFFKFADDSAVIRRAKDTLIYGPEGIRNFYGADHFKEAQVTWAPDFVDVSSDGSLGYTYGKYTWKMKDENGKMNEFSGVFHTVWKKQANGTWKYVWD